MKAMIQKFFRDEEGASAVEYGLLVALIAVVSLLRVRLGQTSSRKIY